MSYPIILIFPSSFVIFFRVKVAIARAVAFTFDAIDASVEQLGRVCSIVGSVLESDDEGWTSSLASFSSFRGHK